MGSDRRADAVVVGAGPAGASSAACLARLGLRVVLVDRATFPRRKACAEYMSPGVEDVLQELGLGSEVDALAPHRVPGMEIVAPSGMRMRIAYERAEGPRHARTVTRERLDETLVRAASRAGAEVLERVTVRTPLVEEGAVRGVVGLDGDREVRLEAPLTIVADGTRSTLAGALGLTVPLRWPVRLGLVAHYSGPGGLRDGYGEMHVSSGGYCGVAPLPGGLLNVAAVVPADALRRSRLSAAAFLDRWIASHPALRSLLAGCSRLDPIRGVVPIGSRTRAQHVSGALLVGDAAGFFDPFTGEGIYRALRSGQLVAEITPRALEAGDLSASNLAVYDAMRRRTFRRKAAVTALVQTFVQYPRLMEYALPRLDRRPAARASLSSVLGDVAPAERFLNPRTLWSALRP